MRAYLGIGISIGLLAGILAQISAPLGIITWVAFASWACYFAAGTGPRGAALAALCTVSGVVWGWVIVQIAGVGFPLALGVAVAIVAFCMCVQAAVPLLAFIPGTFIGAASYFGTEYKFFPTIAALLIGVAFAWASDLLGQVIQRTLVKDRSRPVDPAEPNRRRPRTA